MSARPNVFVGIVALILVWAAYLGFFSIYVYSIYEAVSLNGWKGAFTVIPFFGQMIWAGVKFYSHGFFSTYLYLIYGTSALFGLGYLLSILLGENAED